MVGPDGGTWTLYRTAVRQDDRMRVAAAELAGELESRLADSGCSASLAGPLAQAFSERAVVGAFFDLTLWALTNGYDDGCVDGLSVAELAMKGVPWLVETELATPRVTGQILRDALLKGKVLVEDGGRLRIADFVQDNRRLLGDRARQRKKRASRDSPRTVHGSSTECPPLQEQEQEQEPEEEENSSLPNQESDEDEEPLLQDLLKASRWRGGVQTMAHALSDLRASELSDGEVGQRLAALGKDAVGLKPYDLRDRLLGREERGRGAASSKPAPVLEDYSELERRWAAEDGIDVEQYRQKVRAWSGTPNSSTETRDEGTGNEDHSDADDGQDQG